MTALSSIARPYAKAIVNLANDNSSFQEWRQQLNDFLKVIHSTSLINILELPNVAKIKKYELMDSALNDFSKDFRSFIKLLVSFGKLSLLAEIIFQFEKLATSEDKVIIVDIKTALPLNVPQSEQIVNKIKSKFKVNVELNHIIDESLIAGATLYIEDFVIDNSIKNQLQKLTTHFH